MYSVQFHICLISYVSYVGVLIAHYLFVTSRIDSSARPCAKYIGDDEKYCVTLERKLNGRKIDLGKVVELNDPKVLDNFSCWYYL